MIDIQKDFLKTYNTEARSLGMLFIHKVNSLSLSDDNYLNRYQSIWPIIVSMATRYPEQLLPDINCRAYFISINTMQYVDEKNNWNFLKSNVQDNHKYLFKSLNYLSSIVSKNLQTL